MFQFLKFLFILMNSIFKSVYFCLFIVSYTFQMLKWRNTTCCRNTSHILNYHLCCTSELWQVAMIAPAIYCDTIYFSDTIMVWPGAHYSFGAKDFFRLMNMCFLHRQFFVFIYVILFQIEFPTHCSINFLSATVSFRLSKKWTRSS